MNLMTNELLRKIKRFLAADNVRRCYQLKEWCGVNGVRQRALKRDNNECQECKRHGRKGNADDVHHLKHLRTNPELFLQLDNVITLCKDCHNKAHGRTFNNKKPKNDFTTEERW